MTARRPYDALIKEYGLMLMKDPASFVFVSMADTCIRAGRAKMALDVLEKGLRFHPGMVAAHVGKGRALMALGRRDEAKRTLAYALEQGPENVLARKLLAQCHLETGDPGRGLKLLDEIRAMWPAHEPAKKLYGELKAAIEKTSTDGDYREERPSPESAGREAVETLERWLNNANRMLVKG